MYLKGYAWCSVERIWIRRNEANTANGAPRCPRCLHRLRVKPRYIKGNKKSSTYTIKDQTLAQQLRNTIHRRNITFKPLLTLGA